MKEAPPLQEHDLVARSLVRNIALGSLAVMAVSIAAVVWLMGGLESGYGQTPPPAPTTIGSIEQTLILSEGRGTRERSAGRARLDAVEWVDRDAGIARIPIERAMDLVAADGGTR
jgi:hypothetical protein